MRVLYAYIAVGLLAVAGCSLGPGNQGEATAEETATKRHNVRLLLAGGTSDVMEVAVPPEWSEHVVDVVSQYVVRGSREEHRVLSLRLTGLQDEPSTIHIAICKHRVSEGVEFSFSGALRSAKRHIFGSGGQIVIKGEKDARPFVMAVDWDPGVQIIAKYIFEDCEGDASGVMNIILRLREVKALGKPEASVQ